LVDLIFSPNKKFLSENIKARIFLQQLEEYNYSDLTRKVLFYSIRKTYVKKNKLKRKEGAILL